jgi:hypothetical protein
MEHSSANVKRNAREKGPGSPGAFFYPRLTFRFFDLGTLTMSMQAKARPGDVSLAGGDRVLTRATGSEDENGCCRGKCLQQDSGTTHDELLEFRPVKKVRHYGAEDRADADLQDRRMGFSDWKGSTFRGNPGGPGTMAHLEQNRSLKERRQGWTRKGRRQPLSCPDGKIRLERPQ